MIIVEKKSAITIGLAAANSTFGLMESRTKSLEPAFVSELNGAQREAVVNTDGPALVIAGAGSGKTRVLTYRIAYLLHSGVPPYKILALTFTNKAAREMKERIGKIVGHETASKLWMGTFHSIFSRILRAESEALGYPSTFTIYDTSDSKSLLKTVLKELNLDDQTYKPGDIYGRISMAKNNLIGPQAYAGNSGLTSQDIGAKRPRTAEVYAAYTARCKKSSAMDFDDLLYFTNVLFRDFPDTLRKYQERFSHILVDEYQDTNLAQYMIVKKLSALHHNICVVGDDAQSIYSFRGANIENILNFRNDYPDYRLYKLEQNYRSTQTIVEAANSIIAKNKGQIQKTVFSEKSRGDGIKIIRAHTDMEEGFLVSSDMVDTLYSYRLQYRDFAILYRTNAQSRIFEEALRKRNLPYKIYGSLSFYQRKEIKDVLGYFRLVINPNDDEALKRIINYPARGVGDVTVGKVEQASVAAGCSMWQIVAGAMQNNPGLNAGTLGKILGFAQLIASFQQKLARLPAYELAYEIIKTSGILRDLSEGQAPEDRARKENIEELLNAIKEFTPETDGQIITLNRFMEEVALLTDADEKADAADNNHISLMTIHAAKGLEFEHVYIVGVEEDLFPSQMAKATPRELEEERRLFYVAVTRARERVVLSFAQNRYKWGTPATCTPSRFIADISMEYLDNPDILFGSKNNHEVDSPGMRPNRFTPRQPQTEISANRYLPKIKPINESTFRPSAPEAISAGAKIVHQKFGEGLILKTEGHGWEKKATINFTEIDETKTLLLKFAKLMVV